VVSGHIFIDVDLIAIASSARIGGMGTYLMAKTIRDHLKEGQGVFIDAVPEAEGFYEHIGMKKGEENGYKAHVWTFSHEEALAFWQRTYRDKIAEPEEEGEAKAARELLQIAKMILREE
jgi:hypothetical protein